MPARTSTFLLIFTLTFPTKTLNLFLSSSKTFNKVPASGPDKNL